MTKEILGKIQKILWAALLVSLPVTNFPYFPSALGGSKISVRPLLIYPLILLILFTLLALWKRKLSQAFLPFLVFFILVLISASLPFIQGFTPEISDVSLTSRTFRTIITLFLAAAIYLTVSMTVIDEEGLRFTLRWLYIGMIIALVWGTLQIIYVLDDSRWLYEMMRKIQVHLSINRGRTDRIIGLTQEPSWFADQISALWLPWILSASLMNRTVFKRRWGQISVERILLVWMLIVLVFTLSRAGLAVAAIVVGSGVLFFRPKRAPDKQGIKRQGVFGKVSNFYSSLPGFVRSIILIVTVAAVLGGLVFIVSMESKYIFRMWDYWLGISPKAQAIGSKSLKGYFRYVGFGPRFVYWETAYRTFTNYPLFGVGLGNYTFHFIENLPAVQVGFFPEIITKLIPGPKRVITAKNFFARLLAETGFLGTAAFITFLIVLAGAGLYMWLSKDSNEKFWGAGALLGLIAFLVDTFSYDSFAIPNPWILFGLITAAFTVFIKSKNQHEECLS